MIKLPQAPRRWRGENWNGEDVLQRINQITPFKNWQQPVNSGDDHQPHSTEIALPALEMGHYALVVSDMNDFDVKRSTTGAMLFTVSELGYWYIDDKEGSQVAAILNRRTGLPLQGVKTEFITYKYNAGKQRQEEDKIGEAISDANGWVTVPSKENQSVSLRLTKGNDELFEDEGYHTYRIGRDYTSDQTTLFFSDRSIYRPGQKIYFKGYILDFAKERIPKIVPGKSVEIILYDANGQEQMKKSFTSNDYGTITGQFDLPTGGLTGQMSLSSNHGANRHYFQVEEYKRPKFEIKFDTLRETVRLNEEVAVKGFAKDYAGSSVPNVEVKYRVERVAYRPWWFGYYYKGYWPGQEDRQVLNVGTTTTKNDGAFEVKYMAKPKAGSDPNLMYRFETTVFITDVTGRAMNSRKHLY